MAFLGLDLGGTKLAGAILNPRGKIFYRVETPLQGRTGRAVGELIQKQIVKLRKVAATANLTVDAIGIGVPGIAYAKTGRVWAPNIPGWEDYPLRAEIISALGRQPIPVTVDSDRATCILGEAWQGAARGCSDAIFLAVGTGIGAGIMVNGEVLRGAHDSAGAIGWLALARPFQSKYIPCGCFEHHASGEGLAKVAREILAEQKDYRGPLRGIASVTAHDVFAAYNIGDAVAKKVLAQAIEFWGMASANLVSLFNPERIIFGGGVFGPAMPLLKAIRAEAKKWAQPVAMKRAKFVPSQLGGDAALYGSGYLAQRSLASSR